MASLSWIDLLLRLIPEALLIILAGYAISKKTVNTKLWFLSSIILSLLNFMFRLLPISTVLPMVLSSISAVIILNFINKIKTVKAILSTIICYVILILSEGVNMIFLGKVLGLDAKKIFLTSNSFMKNLYGLPSLLLFALVVISYYLIFAKRNKI